MATKEGNEGVIVMDLVDHQRQLADPSVIDRTGRITRTLLKDDPLRVTMIALAPGAALAEHAARGPITVQTLTGMIRFSALGADYDLRPGALLSVRAGVRHSVSSPDGGVFLLTLATTAEPS